MTATRTLRALALGASLTIAASGSALAVEQNTVSLSNVDVSPFIEVVGLAALVDFDAFTGAPVFSGDSPVANLTMTPGGAVTIETNSAAGYRVSMAFSNLAGAVSAYAIPYGNHDLKVTSPGLVAGDLDFLNGYTYGAFATYAAPSGGAIEGVMECDAACKVKDPGTPESYVIDLRLNVPAAAVADAFTGALTFRAESL